MKYILWTALMLASCGAWANMAALLAFIVIEPRLRSRLDVNTPVLLELLREVRSTARSMHGVERIEMVYNPRRVVRLAREMAQPV